MGADRIESLFHPAPFFLARTPVFPLEEFFKLTDEKEILSHFQSKPLLREAILIASPSLYEALCQEKKQAIAPLFKYLIRISTRPTPFGLFSFVSWGEWNTMTDGTFKIEDIKKRARPDMEWLFKTSKEIHPQTLIKKNPLIQESMGRIIRNAVSVRANPLVRAILDKTTQPVRFDTVCSELSSLFPSLEPEKIETTLKTLVEQEIVLPLILPSLLEVPTYNHSKGEEVQLQVDAVCPTTVYLSDQVQEELTQSVEVLWKMSPGTKYLRDYHEKFLERYGQWRTVPLLELLDENKGLGIPSKTSPKKEESWLQQAFVESIRDRKKEIVLTDAMIPSNPDKTLAPLSFDLFTEIYADSAAAINSGEFLISAFPVLAESEGCSSFGRFIDLLQPSATKKIEKFLRDEEALEPYCCFVECSYFPQNPKHANVAIHPNLRSSVLELGYGKQSTLTLDDIYVGATDKRLYLTLKDGQKEIVIRALDVLNLDLAPPVVRFIRAVSKDKYHLFTDSIWGSLENSFYLPRLRYKKTIFSPARWCPTLALIDATEKDSPAKIGEKLSLWCEKWEVPRYVQLAVEDQRILLDRTIPFHLQEIVSAIKKGPALLVEKIGFKGWMKSDLGMHASECVIPFIKNPKFTAPQSVSIPHTPVPHDVRWKPPGSEWFFAKIFLKKEEEERFLVQHLAPFVQEIKADGWFYIRYHEHIRLRLKTEDASIFKRFHDWTHPLLKNGSIKEVALAAYEREVERYGGEQGIDAAETFFQADSELALTLLSKKTNLPNYVVAAWSLIDLLHGFGLSMFDTTTFDKKYLEGFRKWKSELLSLIQNNPWGNLTEKRRAAQHPHLMPSLTSLFHMHCNRLLGVDRALEAKAHLFASHALLLLERTVKAV